MKYSGFRSQLFEIQVNKALKSVRRILDNNRQPKLAAEVQEHQYDDKYALAEFLTNTAIAAQWNILERMGVTTNMMKTLQEHVRDKRSLTLRFEADDTCKFFKEDQVDVVNTEERIETETTSESILSSTRKGSSTYKVTKKITEYHWIVRMNYKILIYAGSDPKRHPLVLQTRSSSTVVTKTGSKKSVIPRKTVYNPIEVDITWLVEQTMSTAGKKGKRDTVVTMCSFQINRVADDCKTPVRNNDIQKALDFFQLFEKWSQKCITHFSDNIEHRILCNPFPRIDPTVSLITADKVFCPIVPLLEEPEHREVAGTATRQETPKSLLVLPGSGPSESSPLLSLGDIDKFMNEQILSLEDAKVRVSEVFPSDDQDTLITTHEATLTLLWRSSIELSSQYKNSVFYIEHMLRRQLIAAIGKEVQPQDFDQYMTHHMAKLFGSDYRPTPFCYAIRRPNQYPDGILSIEQSNNVQSSKDASPSPVHTFVRHIDGSTMAPLEIPINSATTVFVTGDRYLHGWIRHRFESSRPESFPVVAARARQFSSFLLLVGVMGNANEFHPKNAIIVQNKDEVLIPLLLKELPTAKDFKDAISSLSPEQQRFAKSFRTMQLESSVFGICIVQLKPQLEALLKLPSGALNKEIRLTQDLMSLFVDYQVPSDLLSYDGKEGASLAQTVATVKGHVKAVMEVIDDSKTNQLREVWQETKMSTIVRNESSSDEDCSSESYSRKSSMSESSGSMSCSSLSSERESEGSSSLEIPRRRASFGSVYCRLVDQQRFSVETDTTPIEPDQKPAATTPAEYGHSTSTNDCTTIPKVLDSLFEKHDTDNSLRTTMLKTPFPWIRKRQENLLTKMKREGLGEGDVKAEKNKAFDLLDALSRSGSLEISSAELHIVIAVTHCFENDVMGTVIQDNRNPIEKVERSALMVAKTIHSLNAADMMKDESKRDRLALLFPEIVAEPVDLLTE